MQILILILLVGLNIAPFLFPFIDIWRAQTIWSQALILVMLCNLMIQRPQRPVTRNVPFFLISLWVLGTSYLWLQLGFIKKGTINLVSLFQTINFLFVLIFYIIVNCYYSNVWLRRTLVFLKYCVIANLLICVLQFLNMSQVFTLIRKNEDGVVWNLVTGMLGNGTHLSAMLGSMACLFFKKTRENILALILLFFVLFTTGTTVNDPSATGFIILLATSIYYFWHKNKAISLSIIGLCLIGLLVVSLSNSEFVKDFFSPRGRSGVWGYYIDIFSKSKMPLTGFGIGWVRSVFKSTPFPSAEEVHNEYIQFLLEFGIVAAVLIIYLVIEFFKLKPKSEEGLLCKTMVLGFLISSVTTFPAHLWMPSILACYAYSSFIGDSYASPNKITN